jgi:hypothetical protein
LLIQNTLYEEMKFYSLVLFFILFFIQATFAQDSQVDNRSSELPQINKESLQLSLDVELYPNPAVDFLNITLKNSNLKNVEFEMYNVIGNKMDYEMETVNGVNYKANVKDFNPGYYLLIIRDPIKRYNKAFKFRKQ